jgi:hypothetical protein
MSIPLIHITCTKCNFSENLSTGGNIYQYELPNGERIRAPVSIGWCRKCNHISHILIGLSYIIIEEEMEELIQNLNLVKMIIGKSALVEMRIRDLEYDISKKEKYLLLLNNKTSRHYCIKCGGFDVVPYAYLKGKRGYHTEEVTTFTHALCGGRLKIIETGIRIRYVYRKIIIDPEF